MVTDILKHPAYIVSPSIIDFLIGIYLPIQRVYAYIKQNRNIHRDHAWPKYIFIYLISGIENDEQPQSCQREDIGV